MKHYSKYPPAGKVMIRLFWIAREKRTQSRYVGDEAAARQEEWRKEKEEVYGNGEGGLEGRWI